MLNPEENQSLAALLESASHGSPEALSKFLQCFLDAKVFVPLNEKKTGELARVGKGSSGLESSGYLLVDSVVDGENKKVLPIFSKKEFVSYWANQEIASLEVEVSTLLKLAGEETWMHLDADQAMGKEFSPWEIEELRNGVSGVPAVVSELATEQSVEIEVESHRELYPEIKRKITEVLEVYPAVEEAFMISVKDLSSKTVTPYLGLKFGDISAEKKELLHVELRDISEAVIEELSNGKSERNNPIADLFTDAKPFYIAQIKLPAEGFINKLLSKLKKK